MSAITSSPLGNATIYFYGAGSMAEAIFRGLVEGKLAEPSRITVSNRMNADRLRAIHQQYGVLTAATDQAKTEALREADVVVLGMKPKDAAAAMVTLAPHLRDDQLIVSVIAGLSIGTMERILGAGRAIARTMPNTSSSIGLGATGISFSDAVTAAQRELTLTMFGSIGIATVVEERLIEAVTAVSGSGPAYIYYMMEAMIAAGIKQGLTADAARELTVQTVRGAAEMLAVTGEQPEELRRKVTSPNGTTEAAIRTLESFGFKEGIGRAMDRCAERAQEMGAAIAEEAEKL